MISPISVPTDSTRVAGTGIGSRARAGFTLIELLVVVGIIAVLVALLLPALTKARQAATRVAMGNDLQAIATALEAYKVDYNDYPRVIGAPTDPKLGFEGAIVLCQALIGPTDADDLDDDDKDGNQLTVAATEKKDFGARKRPGGKVFGPYLPPERFAMKAIDMAPVAPAELEATNVLLGRDEQPILYFPRSPAKPNVKILAVAVGAKQPYVDESEASRYDAQDNLGTATKPGPFMRPSEATTLTGLTRIRLMLGDTRGATATDPPDGVIEGAETDIDLPFLLWSAGADGIFGPNANMAGDSAALDAPDAQKCDDVTNFR